MTDHSQIDEAARRLNVSQAAAYKWRKRGLPLWAQLELAKQTPVRQEPATKDAA